MFLFKKRKKNKASYKNKSDYRSAQDYQTDEDYQDQLKTAKLKQKEIHKAYQEIKYKKNSLFKTGKWTFWPGVVSLLTGLRSLWSSIHPITKTVKTCSGAIKVMKVGVLSPFMQWLLIIGGIALISFGIIYLIRSLLE